MKVLIGNASTYVKLAIFVFGTWTDLTHCSMLVGLAACGVMVIILPADGSARTTAITYFFAVCSSWLCYVRILTVVMNDGYNVYSWLYAHFNSVLMKLRNA
ncbi:unnamed protein product [Urochloa humidicola]